MDGLYFIYSCMYVHACLYKTQAHTHTNMSNTKKDGAGPLADVGMSCHRKTKKA